MWPNSQIPANLATFTEKILFENFNFCAAMVPNIATYYFRNVLV